MSYLYVKYEISCYVHLWSLYVCILLSKYIKNATKDATKDAMPYVQIKMYCKANV